MAQPPSAVDDDDDDTSLDDDSTLDDDDTNPDDDSDDDDSTTTSTTTVTTTTSTTTTTQSLWQPGDACNPHIVYPQDTPPEPFYGPWPAFESNGVVRRQIISSGVGEGPNDMLYTSDGKLRIVVQDGRSLDVLTVDTDGTLTRETIDPYGGEWKVIGKDAQDHLYVVYTFEKNAASQTWELKFATNKTGSWEVATLVTSVGTEFDFDFAVAPSGLVHIVYTGANYRASVHYATYDGETLTTTQIVQSNTVSRFGCAIALDASGSPHLVYTDDSGIEYWRLVDNVWTGSLGGAGELVRRDATSWDILVDETGTVHVGAVSWTGHLLYALREDGAWTVHDLDPCHDWANFITLRRDGEGFIHLTYTDDLMNDVQYTTNRTGKWVFTKVYEELIENDNSHAWDMAMVLDESDDIHVVHRREIDSTLNLTTNTGGEWVRRPLIFGSGISFTPAAMDSDDRLHLAFERIDDHQYPLVVDRLMHGVLDGGTWTESLVEDMGGTGHFLVGGSSIQTDQYDGVHVLYGMSTGVPYDSLKLAHFDGIQWTIETLVASLDGYGYARPLLGIDGVGHFHLLVEKDLAGDDEMHYATKADGTWQFETIPAQTSVLDSLMLDPDNRPTIELSPFPRDTWHIMRRSTFGDWSDEIAFSVMDPDATIGGQATMRGDGTIDLIGWSSETTPDGLFYGTNESGNWVADFLSLKGAFTRPVLDSEENIHFGLRMDFSDSLPPEGYALYDITNADGIWKTHYIDFYDSIPISLHHHSDGTLQLLYDGFYAGGAALISATFDPD